MRQQLFPAIAGERFEGIAFSSTGSILGVATADTNAVQLFRRRADGRFEDAPYCRIDGLTYPHDIAFAKLGDKETLAVAERGGALVFFQQEADGTFGPEPRWVIAGQDAGLNYSDGVAFVPGSDLVAACNLAANSISFYRMESSDPLRFSFKPASELRHPCIAEPDGLGFSACGRWLAIANHGADTVSIFARSTTADGVRYGPAPFTVIEGAGMRYPHSVAFTDWDFIVATSAGANHFSVFATPWTRGRADMSTPELVHQQTVNDEAAFHEVNSTNKMEGGPKGIAIHGRDLAVCSPEIGIKIFELDAAQRGAAPRENSIQIGHVAQSSGSFGTDYLSEFERVIRHHVKPVTRAYLEWGMGHTTLALLEMRSSLALDHLYSVDNDATHFNALVAQCPKWEGFHPLHCDLTGPVLTDRDDELNYATLPLSLSQRFDLIFIGGRRRMECALTASWLCHRDSIVVLHDYRRARYQHVTALFDVVEDGPQFRVMRPRGFLSKATRSLGALRKAVGGRLSG